MPDKSLLKKAEIPPRPIFSEYVDFLIFLIRGIVVLAGVFSGIILISCVFWLFFLNFSEIANFYLSI